MNTTYFLNQVMGNVFKTKTTPALPGGYYIGLSSTTPKADGTGVTEPVTSAGYARVKLESLSAPANGVITNTAAISFNESTANWGTMTHFVIYDAATGGNLLMFDALSPVRPAEEGTVITIKNGKLSLALTSS